MKTVDVIRLAWGTLLAVHPDPLLRATGRPPDAEATTVARVLGARHLVQAATLAALPHLPSRLFRSGTVQSLARRAGAVADVAHATSALALAVGGVAPATWAADGVVASTFATFTWRSAAD